METLVSKHKRGLLNSWDFCLTVRSLQVQWWILIWCVMICVFFPGFFFQRIFDKFRMLFVYNTHHWGDIFLPTLACPGCLEFSWCSKCPKIGDASERSTGKTHTKCAMNLCYPWAMFAFAGCWTCFLAKCPSVTKGKPADNHDKHGYPSMKFCDPGDAQLAAQVLGSSIKNMTSWFI